MKVLQRVLSWVLVFCLILSMVPVTGWAEENTTEITAETVEQDITEESVNETDDLKTEDTLVEEKPGKETVAIDELSISSEVEPTETVMSSITDKKLIEESLVESLMSMTKNSLGDGWGRWSDYVIEDSVITYSVPGGNLYFGHESYMIEDEKAQCIYLLSADSTITEAIIPETINGLSVTHICNSAFSGCVELTSIHIPNRVFAIGDNAFLNCGKLEKFTVDEDNMNYYAQDGVLYHSYDTFVFELVRYPSAKTETFYCIPNETTDIASYAFDGSALREIYIPTSITYIGYGAFSKCNYLDTIHYAGSLSQFEQVLGYENCSLPDVAISFFDSVPNEDKIIADSLWAGDITACVVSIKDTSILEMDYRDFIKCDGYFEFIEAVSTDFQLEIDTLTFAIKDLNKDNNSELIVAVSNEIGWTHYLIFSKTSGQIEFWGAVYSYLAIMYSATQNTISYVMTNDYSYDTFQIDSTGITLTGTYDNSYTDFDWMSKEEVLADLSNPKLFGWQKAYYDFIVKDKQEADFDWDNVTYELVYLNDDSIPELWIDYCYNFAGSRIVSYYNDRLITELLSSGTLTYEEQNNAFYHSWGHMGVFCDTVYQLTEEGLVEVAVGSYNMYNQNGQITDHVTTWEWNNQTVSEEKYTEYLNECVDSQEAFSTGENHDLVYDYDGILDLLTNFKVNNYRLETSLSAPELSVKTGQIIAIPVYLYLNGEKVNKWEQPQFSFGHVETGGELSYLNWDETEDGGHVLHMKALTPGTADILIYDTGSDTSLKLTVDVSLAEVHEYFDNSSIEINGGGIAFAYYIGEPNQTFYYTVNGKESSAQSNEKGIICVPLGTFENQGTHDVVVQFTRIGNINLDSKLVFKTKVTITSVEFTQSWLASFDASVAPKASAGGDVKFGPIEAEATFGKAQAKFGIGSTMEISREYSDDGDTLVLSTERSVSAEGTLKSGVTAKAIAPKFTILEVSAGADADVSGTYGIKIENFSAENTDHRIAIATYILGESLQANPGNLIFNSFHSRLAEYVYINSGCEIIEGSSADFHTSAGSGVGVFKIGGEDLCSAIDYGVDCSISFSEQKTNKGEATKESGYKTGANIALCAGNLIHSDNFKLAGAYLGKDFLGTDIKVSAKNSVNGRRIDATYLSASSSDLKWLILGEHTIANYGNYSFYEKTLTDLIENTDNFNSYVNGNRICLSIADIVEMGDYISSSKFPIDYSAQTKDKLLYSLPLELGASLGFGADLSVVLTYLEDTSYVNSTGYATNDSLLITGQSVDLSNQIDNNTFRIEEFFLEVIPSLADEAKNFFTEMMGSVQDGVKTIWAEISGNKNSKNNWNITLIYTDEGNCGQAFATCYAISAIEQKQEAVSEGVSGVGNYSKSKAATIGRPFIIKVTDNATGAEITDLRDEPLEFTIRYALEDLEAAGLSEYSPIVVDECIAMYRYSDEGDYFEYIGGVNDRDAMTVTATITQTGQYVLAVDACAPSLSYLDISDFHSNPTITAYIDDLSGLNMNGFVFKLDDVVRVDGNTVSEYYNAEAGVFVYTVSEGETLNEGTHAISFALTDTTGNSETYEYSFNVDLTAPVIADVTVNGETNKGAVVEIRAQVSDANLTDVHAVFSKLLPDGSWSEEVSTPMCNMGDDVWGLDYEGDGSSVRVYVKAIDIAENVTSGETFEAYPHAESLSLPQKYLTIHRGKTVQLPADVQPVELMNSLLWSVDDESVITVDETGTITAVGVGTAYVIASVTDGETTLTARCRVDVTEELVLDGVQLSETKATTELYSADHTQLELLLKLPQNYPMLLNQRTNSGIALQNARFTDETVAELFELQVLDDRHVQIVPTAAALENAKNVKSSYTSAITVTVGDKEYTTEETLKLTVKKSTPKLKVTVPAFNSFYTEQSQAISVTGGTVKSIALESAPDWLVLDGEDLVLTENAPKKSLSGKVTLLVETEEWNIPAKLTVSVKNTYKAPGLKLSATTVTLGKDVVNSSGIRMKLLCKSSKDTLEAMNVTGIAASAGYRIENFDADAGEFVLKAEEGFQAGKISLNVFFADTENTLPLSLTVKTADVKLKLSKTSITLNADVRDSAVVALSATPADYRITAPEIKLLDAVGGNKLNSGELDIQYEDGKLYVATTDQTPANASYKLTVSAGGSKTVTLTVKTTNKAPEVSLKAVNGMDLSFPEKESTVTATFRNYNGTISGYTYTITEMKGKKVVDANAAEKFILEQDGNVFRIRTKEGAAIDPKSSYTLSLKLILSDGTELPEKTAKLTVKRTAVKLKLSKTKLTLNRYVLDAGTIAVTCATKGYAYTSPIWTVTDSKGNAADTALNVRYADGQLTVAANENTAYGTTYKVQLKANEFAPAATLTVTIPAYAKSQITGSIKVSGSIDVIRDSSVVTVTPSYKNVTSCTKMEERIEIYCSADNYTKPVTELFSISRNKAGAFVLTKAEGAAIDHSLKYKVQLTTVFNETLEGSSKAVSVSVKMGSAKLTLSAKDTTLFSGDKNDRLEFTVRSSDAKLNDVAEVTIKDSKYQKLFEVYDYGNGKFAIGFKDGAVDSKLIGKTITLNLNVKIEGNETTSYNARVALKFKILRAVLVQAITIMQGINDVTGEILQLYEGGSFLLQGISEPSNASDFFEWTSSNPSVVAVNPKYGVVEGIGVGTAVLSCNAVDGSGVSASVTINVSPGKTESKRSIEWYKVNTASSYNGAGKLTGFLLQGMFFVDSENHEGFTVENSSGFEEGAKPFYVDSYNPGYMYFSFWLPNDSSLVGWHTLTVCFDGTYESVDVYLEYLGDYSHAVGTENSVKDLGWVVKEWKPGV